MNNTKWEELRIAMYELPVPAKWRSKDLSSGYISSWDSDWYYHFKLTFENIVSNTAYREIEWVEISLSEKKDKILSIMQKIHVPGEVVGDSVIVYGYIQEGTILNYL